MRINFLRNHRVPMSEIEGDFEDALRSSDASAVPAREGLPPSYRMRASSHYVEQLDSDSFSSPIRYIDAKTIDAREDAQPPSGAFVESIRRHGVLQPLLVQGRDGTYRLIAGRKRLSAALAAGLREVPCLVQRVGEREAGLLAAATNVSSVEPAPEPPAPAADDAAQGPGRAEKALAHCLSGLASSANLLSSGTSLTNGVAIDLVKAESARALQLLVALRVLGSGVNPVRVSVAAEVIANRAAEETAAERRLRGLDLVVRVDEPRGTMLHVDEDLITAAVAALITATGSITHASRVRRMTLSVVREMDGVVFRVSQDAVALNERQLARIFELDGFDRADEPAAGVLLHAAQHIAAAHRGRTTAGATVRGSSLSLVVPASAGEDLQ